MKNRKTMTFVDALKNGDVEYDDIDTYINMWHKGNSTLTIYEFLGMKKEEYFMFLKYHKKALKKMFPKKK